MPTSSSPLAPTRLSSSSGYFPVITSTFPFKLRPLLLALLYTEYVYFGVLLKIYAHPDARVGASPLPDERFPTTPGNPGGSVAV
jgi:hypothetical protein